MGLACVDRDSAVLFTRASPRSQTLSLPHKAGPRTYVHSLNNFTLSGVQQTFFGIAFSRSQLCPVSYRSNLSNNAAHHPPFHVGHGRDHVRFQECRHPQCQCQRKQALRARHQPLQLRCSPLVRLQRRRVPCRWHGDTQEWRDIHRELCRQGSGPR